MSNSSKNMREKKLRKKMINAIKKEERNRKKIE